jgi:hypothetical protein
MKRRNLAALIIFTLSLLGQRAYAAEMTDTTDAEPLRPVLAAYTAGVGTQHISDTYITPLDYSGWNTSLRFERMQAMKFNPGNWVMQLQGQLDGGRLLGPAKISEMWSMYLKLDWAMMHRFRPAADWQILVGGTTGLDIGINYLQRNGNNPVAAKASWTVGVIGEAAYNHRFGKLPITFRYMVDMPLTGIFFSPAYGELYYEIYLGNRSGLVHAAYPGNYFRLNNLLTADLHFGATTLRLGYQCNIFSSKVSSIITNRTTHQFVIGVVSEWLSLDYKHRHRLDNAKIISALY